MATGSYQLGAEVKIPIQITLESVPYPGYMPVVEKIIKPNGTLVAGFPANAEILDASSAMYYYAFTPDMSGDYIAIIKNTINGQDYYAYENFTVSNLSQVKAAPRAEPR
jgi:hypothetical protein